MRKKSFYCLLLVALCSFVLQFFAACSNNRIVATISNKAALTAEWIAEDDDRSLELTFNPSSYNADNIATVVSSSDSNVVLASGTKLSAIGPGTATISVAVEGTITDSVEVSVKAKQTGIVISNVQEISSDWTLGESDRTLEVAKVYKRADSVPLTSAEVEVTSSNPDAVSASGLTLSAKAVGKSTITVKAGDFETSVEVTVKPPLQSFSIDNQSELATVSFGLTYEMQPSFTPAEAYTKDNTTPTVEFGTEGILRYEGGYRFKALNVGSTSVRVTVAGKTVEFDVIVEIGVPTLEFESDDNFNEETCIYNVVLQTGEQTKTFELPKVTARSGAGNDISDSVVADTTINITDGTVTLGAGTYTINYSVTDPRDTGRIARKTLTLNVIGSTFAINPTYSTNGIRMFAESVDENGNVSATPARGIWSESDATFNMQASTLYYAETTFTYNVTSDLPMFGLAHYKTLNETIADGDPYNNAGALLGRRCIESVMTSNGKFLIKDLKPTDDHWYENFRADNIYLNESFKANATFTTMTIAIARNGNTIYTFVDGKLVDASDIAWDYWDGKLLTTPGIISCGARDDFTVSDITVLSGPEAQTKLNEVTTAASIFGNNPTYTSTKGYAFKTYREYLGEDKNVKIKSDRDGEIAATFNMEASTLYYAEATFNVTNTSNYPAFGLAHYLALNTSVNEAHTETYDAGSRLGRECVASIKSGTSATFLIGNLTAGNERWYNAYALYKNSNFQANNFTQMTVAIARTADKMYTFVNGKLVKEIDAPEGYKNVATTPGIITICDANLFIASNIQLLSGDAAQNKITELTTAPNA